VEQQVFRGYAWMDDAACAGYPEPDIWYPDTKSLYSLETRQAQAICATCPVRAECYAFGQEQNYGGIYGGVLFIGRRPAPNALPPLPTEMVPAWRRPQPVQASTPATRQRIRPTERRPVPTPAAAKVVQPAPVQARPEPATVTVDVTVEENVPVVQQTEPVVVPARVPRKQNWFTRLLRAINPF
jgi:Transcription factor WhiB